MLRGVLLYDTATYYTVHDDYPAVSGMQPIILACANL